MDFRLAHGSRHLYSLTALRLLIGGVLLTSALTALLLLVSWYYSSFGFVPATWLAVLAMMLLGALNLSNIEQLAEKHLLASQDFGQVERGLASFFSDVSRAQAEMLGITEQDIANASGVRLNFTSKHE